MPYFVDNSFTLENSLCGTFKLTKNADPDKYFYSGYGISFNVLGTVLLTNCGFGKNVIIFMLM